MEGINFSFACRHGQEGRATGPSVTVLVLHVLKVCVVEGKDRTWFLQVASIPDPPPLPQPPFLSTGHFKFRRIKTRVFYHSRFMDKTSTFFPFLSTLT